MHKRIQAFAAVVLLTAMQTVFAGTLPKPLKATSYAMLVLAGSSDTIAATKFEGYPNRQACNEAIGEVNAQRQDFIRRTMDDHPKYMMVCVPMYTPPMNYAGYTKQ